MSRSISLPDHLYDRLGRIARQEGLSIEQLLARWAREIKPIENSEDDLLLACTRSLLYGDSSPLDVPSESISQEILGSEPVCKTIEAAMSSLRSRSWRKDE